MPQYWFFITNSRTRQSFDVVAGSAETACGKYGWAPDDCAVIPVGELVERPSYSDPRETAGGTPPGGQRNWQR
jgi:hypothetical protein